MAEAPDADRGGSLSATSSTGWADRLGESLPDFVPEPVADSEPTHPSPANFTAQLVGLGSAEQLQRIHDLVNWLVKSGNEVQRQQYRNALTTAKIIRVSDWQSMLMEARRDAKEKQRQKQEQERAASSAAMPDCPYLDIEGRTFILTDQGGPVLLAEFVPQIVAEVSRDDGAEVTHHFTIQLTTPAGRVVHVETPAAHLIKAREWSIKGLGASARIVPMSRDEARVADAAQYFGSESWSSVVKYVHTGWRLLGGEWRYLTASGALGEHDLDNSVVVDLDAERLNHYRLPDPGEVASSELTDAILASIGLLDVAPDSTTSLMLGAAYQAPLPLPPETSVFIAGPSGSMKSVVSALACQHFGAAFDYKTLPAEWKSTGNSLEAMAHQLADVLFLVDDYAPQSVDDPRKLAATADRLLRGAANASARGRLRKDGTQAPQRQPRAQILATGEDVPPGESLRARLTIAMLKPGSVNMRLLDEAQAAGSRGTYALAMAGYVRWLAQRRNAGEDLADVARQRIAAYRAELSTGRGHLRAPGAAASLLTAWRMWLEYAIASGALSTPDAKAVMRRVRAAVTDSVLEQAEHTSQMRIDQIYVSALSAALAGGRAHLGDRKTLREPRGTQDPLRWGWAPVEGSDLSPTVWRSQGDCIGHVDSDSGDVYLNPDVAYETAVTHAKRAQVALNASKSSVNQHLEQADALVSVTRNKDGKTSQATVAKRIGGTLKRVLHLRRELLTGEQPDDGRSDEEAA